MPDMTHSPAANSETRRPRRGEPFRACGENPASPFAPESRRLGRHMLASFFFNGAASAPLRAVFAASPDDADRRPR